MNIESVASSYIGGIPMHIFEQPYGKGRVKGLYTSEWISYDMRPDEVWITAVTKKVKFHALATNGSMRFSVRTYGYNNNWDMRHPDFNGKALLRTSIAYFDTVRHIHEVVGEWKHDAHLDENYTKYIAALPEYPTEADKIRAASHTWTATVLYDAYGFICTHVDDPYPNTPIHRVVYPVFTRPYV